MKFRHHRGGLKESMDTVVDVFTLDALKELIKKEHSFFKLKKIHFRYMGYDSRIDWETYLVCVDFEGVMPETPIGMSNGKLEE